jgi:hypothetical protein
MTCPPPDKKQTKKMKNWQFVNQLLNSAYVYVVCPSSTLFKEERNLWNVLKSFVHCKVMKRHSHLCSQSRRMDLIKLPIFLCTKLAGLSAADQGESFERKP